MKREKSLAIGYLLAFFLGGLGTHLFYYRKYLRGILYLLFSWTYIPIILGWIDMLFVKKWTHELNKSPYLEHSNSNVIKDNWRMNSEHNEPITGGPLYKDNKVENLERTNVSRGIFKDKEHSRVESANETENYEMENYKKAEVTNRVVRAKTKDNKKDRFGFVKDTFQFYNENEIILPQYSHLKAPRDILEHLHQEDKGKTIKSQSGISINIAMSNHNGDFTSDSLKFAQSRGSETKEIPFQSYWPTFKSLDKRQLKWYFYWREQALKGNYIEIDLSYIFIFVYELLNYSFNKNAAFNVSMLARLFENYKLEQPKLPKYLEPWIADMLYELGEDKLAEEWDDTKANDSKLYRQMEARINNLESISINTWKPYIRNYNQTVFFEGNKNRIYNKFKQSISLLNQEYIENDKNILEEWFQRRDNREIRTIFRSAVVDRVDKQIHVRKEELLPTEELSNQVSNMFRLAENVVRIENGENRQIKVNEEVLPENMREKMINHNRFKTVQTRDTTNVNGSPIPKSPFTQEKETIAQAKEQNPKQKLELDWEEIDRKEKDLNSLTNKIEVTEIDEGDEPALNNEKMVPNNEQSDNHSEDSPTESDFLGEIFEGEADLEGLEKSLTEVEKEFLLLFTNLTISLDTANDFARENRMMLNFFVTGINEKANEYLNDVLLDINEETIEVIEDYEDIIIYLKDD